MLNKFCWNPADIYLHPGYYETELVKFPVDADKIEVVKNPKYFNQIPQLETIIRHLILPWTSCFYSDDFINFERVRAIRRYRSRTCILNNDDYVYSMDLGIWRSEDSGKIQEFRLGIKGCGSETAWNKGTSKELTIRLLEEKQLSKLVPQIRQIKKTGNWFGEVPLAFAYADHSEDRAVGAQNGEYAIHSVNIDTGRIKYAPSICAIQFPNDLVHHILSTTDPAILDDLNGRNLSFYQELRLMPSQIRAIHLDTDNDKQLTGILKSISEEPTDLEIMLGECIKDGVEYFKEHITRTRSSGDIIDSFTIGDCLIYHLEDNPKYGGPKTYIYNTDGKHERSHYLTKDMVIAQSGLWWVDGESIGSTICEKSKFRDLSRLQSLSILRDYTRILTRIAVGIELLKGKELDEERRREIQTNIHQRFYDALNNTSFININSNGSRRLIFDIYYPELENHMKFYFPKTSLNPIY